MSTALRKSLSSHIRDIMASLPLKTKVGFECRVYLDPRTQEYVVDPGGYAQTILLRFSVTKGQENEM